MNYTFGDVTSAHWVRKYWDNLMERNFAHFFTVYTAGMYIMWVYIKSGTYVLISIYVPDKMGSDQMMHMLKLKWNSS